MSAENAIFALSKENGEMAERSIAAVLKTVEANYLQGFESLSLRIFFAFLVPFWIHFDPASV